MAKVQEFLLEIFLKFTIKLIVIVQLNWLNLSMDQNQFEQKKLCHFHFIVLNPEALKIVDLS